ncbi:MAG: hypothetical protein ACYTJ0_02865 [Planctomycetota bacterium]|jgi:hypothetical protein
MRTSPLVVLLAAAGLLAPLASDAPRAAIISAGDFALAGPSHRTPAGGVAGAAGPRECPPGVTYGQRPHQPNEPFVFDTSDTEPVRSLFEQFQHDGSDVTNIWFWGADVNLLVPAECDEPNPLFNVTFHPDDGSGQPDLAAVLCDYQDVPAAEKVFKDAYPIPGTALVVDAFQYKVTFDPPCPLPPGPHWVKVQGIGGEARCWFLWLSSPEGDGVHYVVEPPPGPSGLQPNDLSLCINRPSVQAPNCPADTDDNKRVDVDDLVNVILNWGPCPPPCPPACPGDVNGDCSVDVDDLVAIILAWGPCPAPPNDECEGKIVIDRLDAQGTMSVPFDMRGATPSPEPLQCLDVAPGLLKDAWWCLHNASDAPKIVTIRTTVDLLIEVTDGCICPPGPLVACGPGIGGGATFPMAPGQRVCVRLVNDNALPNEQLKGVMVIENEPAGPPVNFYFDPASFFEALAATQKTEKFFWDFKPDFLQPGEVVPIVDPLNILTHPTNAPGVWSDATGTSVWPVDVDNVTFTSNPAPPGGAGLAYAKAPAFGLDNNALFAEEPGLSFDIISGPPAGDNHTAFLLELVALGGSGATGAVLEVTVFDKNGNPIGSTTVSMDAPSKRFLGILTKDPALTIGRINIVDLDGGFEGISAIAAFWQAGPAPSGACCLPDGTCVVTTQSDCESALGGIYVGDFTTCLGVTCPPATGACCLPDGTCIVTTGPVCDTLGGIYQGDNVPCTAVECPFPIGACCLPDGTCIITIQSSCESPVIGGVYQGDNVPCVAVNCPPPDGACCLPDGTCVQITAIECQELSGLYQGNNVPCTAVECPFPIGACCLPDGSCVITTQSSCESPVIGGVYQGDNVPCVAGNCPPPAGACCLPDGTCIVTTGPVCATLGGIFQGPNVPCTAVECPFPIGACCLPDGTCIITTQSSCESPIIGGVYQGDNVPCVAVQCPPPDGACCLPDGTCVPLPAIDCEELGGIFQGPNVPCTAVECPFPIGACCLPDGSCIITVQSSCEHPLIGGVYQGDGVPCLGIQCPPPAGACCLPDGTCAPLTALECKELGGLYQGAGVPCVAGTCP